METLPGAVLAALVGLGALGRGRRRAVAARHIVLADPGCPLEECAAHVAACGARVIYQLPLIHGVICSCPGPATLSALSGHPGVVAVEADWRVPLAGSALPVLAGLGWPLEALLGPPETVPWGVERIGAPRVWSRTRGEGVRVAVVDTGVATEHPDLRPNLRGGFNLLDPGEPPEDDSGHGTHVAGVIAATDNDLGVVGVAPRCELYAVKAFNASGAAATSDVLTALQWCAEYGMQVVNMSFGQPEDSPSVARAVAALERRGVVLVAAAGNHGPRYPAEVPARYPQVLAVTGTDRRDRFMLQASRGDGVDLAAPGYRILSLGRDGGTRWASGTSMAAPHVAGAAALLLSAYPDLTPAEVRELLIRSAEPLPGADGENGVGLVRVDRALALADERRGRAAVLGMVAASSALTALGSLAARVRSPAGSDVPPAAGGTAAPPGLPGPAPLPADPPPGDTGPG